VRYSVILADPPWAYRDKRRHLPGGIRYGTMSESALCALDVRSISAQDSALLLWATPPHLPVALRVMDAWGFRYKTVAFTWVKMQRDGNSCWGMGHYTRANAEIVLLGTRGRPHVASHSVRSAVLAPRGRHSEKPAEVHRRIEQLFGDVPRVELFARSEVPGWRCLGNEIDGMDIAAALAAERERT
jgi:N6-adenosine-specific RNA methylase IME4